MAIHRIFEGIIVTNRALYTKCIDHLLSDLYFQIADSGREQYRFVNDID